LRGARSIAAGSTQPLKEAAVAQGAGLAGKHRHEVPGVIKRVATAKCTGMLGDNASVWRMTTALAATEYLLLSNRTRQVFETDAGTAWNPSNLPA
jgi:hypothetical protein